MAAVPAAQRSVSVHSLLAQAAHSQLLAAGCLPSLPLHADKDEKEAREVPLLAQQGGSGGGDSEDDDEPPPLDSEDDADEASAAAAVGAAAKKKGGAAKKQGKAGAAAAAGAGRAAQAQGGCPGCLLLALLPVVADCCGGWGKQGGCPTQV
jgi:hypothetical protein